MNEPGKHYPSKRSWSHKTIYCCCFVQLPSSVWFFVTPWTAAHQAYLSLTISRSLPKFMSIELVMPSNHLVLCCAFSCPQSFPASGSFPVSWLFPSGDQSVGASASVLPMNIRGWFPLRLTCLISLLSKGLARVFSSTTVRKHQFFSAQPSASNENSSSPQGLA